MVLGSVITMFKQKKPGEAEHDFYFVMVAVFQQFHSSNERAKVSRLNQCLMIMPKILFHDNDRRLLKSC